MRLRRRSGQEAHDRATTLAGRPKNTHHSHPIGPGTGSDPVGIMRSAIGILLWLLVVPALPAQEEFPFGVRKQRPLTKEHLEQKFADQAQTALPTSQIEDVMALCWEIEGLDSVGELARAAASA